MPLRDIAEIVSPMAKSVVDFIPGNDLVTHSIGGFKLGPIICYEIIKDGLVREMSNSSDAFIVQTNSATFANTPESAQQLAITRIRAVEHSRSIMSVSTVGISAFIDSNGRVLKQTEENKKSFLVGVLTMNSHRTFIDRISD